MAKFVKKKNGKSTTPAPKLVPAKPVAVAAPAVEEPDPIVITADFSRVSEHTFCDRFELEAADNNGEGAFFARKGQPQAVYFKHAAFRAKRVRVIVEVLEAAE
jgi:hypothetical protein